MLIRGQSFQLLEVFESWLGALLCGSSALGSPVCTVLDVCGSVPHEEQLCLLLISNCNDLCKSLVASFVTAGQYL